MGFTGRHFDTCTLYGHHFFLNEFFHSFRRKFRKFQVSMKSENVKFASQFLWDLALDSFGSRKVDFEYADTCCEGSL